MAAALVAAGWIVAFGIGWCVARGMSMGEIRRLERMEYSSLAHPSPEFAGQLTRLQELLEAMTVAAVPTPAVDRALERAMSIVEQVTSNLTSPPTASPMTAGIPEEQIAARVDELLREQQDWTDSIPSLNYAERGLVGGLAPGQGIPGIGDEAADDAWRDEYEQSDARARGISYEEYVGDVLVTAGDGDEPLPDVAPGPMPWVEPRHV